MQKNPHTLQCFVKDSGQWWLAQAGDNTPRQALLFPLPNTENVQQVVRSKLKLKEATLKKTVIKDGPAALALHKLGAVLGVSPLFVVFTAGSENSFNVFTFSP